MLPQAAELNAIDNLQGLKDLVGIPASVWTAFTTQVGDPGNNFYHQSGPCRAGGATLASGTKDGLPEEWGSRAGLS